MGGESIFQKVDLPTATTWFYFSLLLAVALFFKFSRLLSMRNLDLALVFLPVPGLLLLQEAGGSGKWGFIWLISVSLVLLLRCLFDLSLERRPALAPNLSPGGLAWLACAMFGGLVVVAAEQPRAYSAPEKKGSPLTEAIERQSEQPLDRLPIPTTRTLAVLCHLAVVVGLVLIGWRHFHDVHAGMAAATFYLLLPYTFMLMPYNGPLGGQWHHVWPTALLIWALFLYRQPTFAGLLLGVAAASVYYPILLLPVWLSFYRKNGGGRFVGAFVGGAGACVLWLVLLSAFSGITSVWPMDIRDWLPWTNPDADPTAASPSFWLGVHWAYRMPVFLLFLVLLFGSVLWPAPKNLAHLIAQSAALILGVQLWYADRGGMHVLWYLPLLLLLIFRPNLTTSVAPPISPENDWLVRARRALARCSKWIVGQPRPPVPATGSGERGQS